LDKQYPDRLVPLPVSISKYESGNQYVLSSNATAQEEFDRGGDFSEVDPVPLITYFSLRHGFKETKLTVTAASESLTAETLPQWTLLTLSHEIMHSRVRDIFHSLFGVRDNLAEPVRMNDSYYRSFQNWYAAGRRRDGVMTTTGLLEEIRSVVLNFCCAMERAEDMKPDPPAPSDLDIGPDKLGRIYLKHKRRAVELFVHFHDFYFTYAANSKLYAMSLWASWLRVAAPIAHPREYLIRTLATLACGQGVEPERAYTFAKATLNEALESLQANGVRSPLFDELLRIMEGEADLTYAFFKASYYLMDQVRLLFASRRIATLIERFESDPLADGSDQIEDYLTSVYVFGERDAPISPVRFVLASLCASLTGKQPIADMRWLSAWNLLVVSSQGGAL
jgi:hypothetical protein